VREGQVLPAGRLREPVDVLRHAHALITSPDDVRDVSVTAAAFGVPRVFGMTRALGVPRLVEPWGHPPRVPRSAPVMALAATARPDDFFAALEAEGWHLVARRAFADHHRFTREDLAQVATDVRASKAALVLTTEKDMMRLLPWRPLPVPAAWVPLKVGIAPADTFASWLLDALARARGALRVPDALVTLPERHGVGAPDVTVAQ
jgi:tetraacyldisaccharide 4'-kinase